MEVLEPAAIQDIAGLGRQVIVVSQESMEARELLDIQGIRGLAERMELPGPAVFRAIPEAMVPMVQVVIAVIRGPTEELVQTGHLDIVGIPDIQVRGPPAIQVTAVIQAR